jgi:hypothetical protein
MNKEPTNLTHHVLVELQKGQTEILKRLERIEKRYDLSEKRQSETYNYSIYALGLNQASQLKDTEQDNRLDALKEEIDTFMAEYEAKKK